MTRSQAIIAYAMPGVLTSISGYRLWAYTDLGLPAKAGVTAVMLALFWVLIRILRGDGRALP